MVKHYSHNIQNAIQRELFNANSSIKIAVAWFTNDLLFQPLLLKLGAGVSVELILNKDEINCSADNEVDFDKFVNAGGVLRWNDSKQLIHQKFCIIDNRIVINGSYNWTNKAEYNSEVESFFYDEKETTQFYNELYEQLSLRFEKVESVFKNNIEEVSDTINSFDNGFFIDEFGVKYSNDRKRLIKVPGDELRIVYINRPRVLQSSGKCPKSYRIPDGVTSIEDYAFSVCASLKSIYIPNSVKSIGKGAFSNCRSLTSIHIPDSVATIGEDAFSECVNLESIRLSKSLNGIGDRTFSYCEKLKHINIPNRVTYIGNSAFSCCRELESIDVPESVKRIGDSAFFCCKELKSIDIPDSVKRIGDRAFYGCERLISIHLPNKITSIEKETFSLCRRLRSIIIPNMVTSIGEEAFWFTDLTSINIPESVTYIGERAIGNTLISTINIPIGTKSKLEKMKFGRIMRGRKIVEYYGIDDLLKIVFDFELENAWTDKYGAKYSQDRKRLLKAPTNDISNYSIRNGTKVICDKAFYECFKLTSVHIPDSVTCIGKSAFSGCKNLTSIYIPDSVIDIDSLAFFRCWKLSSIRLPNNLTSIGRGAFGSCKNIKSITLPESVIRIDIKIFAGCDKLPTVYIPVGTKSKFENLLPEYKDRLIER